MGTWSGMRALHLPQFFSYVLILCFCLKTYIVSLLIFLLRFWLKNVKSNWIWILRQNKVENKWFNVIDQIVYLESFLLLIIVLLIILLHISCSCLFHWFFFLSECVPKNIFMNWKSKKGSVGIGNWNLIFYIFYEIGILHFCE